MHIKNIYLLLLILIHTLSVSIYYLVEISAYQKDIIFLISLLVLLANIKKVKQFIHIEDKYIYLFPLYAIVSTVIMAMFNYGQPVIYSLLASRILLISAVLYIALSLLLDKIDNESLYKVFFCLAIFIATINFYIYISGNTSILYIDMEYAYRMGSLRVTIASQTATVLLFFFFYYREERVISYIPFLLLLFNLIIVTKTRGILLAVAIIMTLSILSYKNIKKNIYIIYFFITILILSIIETNFESSILQPLIDMVQTTQNELHQGKGNIDVRALELAYFWKHLDIYSIIFGYGMDNHTFKFLYYEKYYLSDLGIFKVFYLHGIVGLLLFGGIYFQLYKQASLANTPIHKTGKALILYQIFAPTLNVIYNTEGVMMLYIVYILIKKANRKDKLYG